MSSESKALFRLRATENIVKDRKKIDGLELESLLFYTYGILPRTVARYVDCLMKIGKIHLEGSLVVYSEKQ